MENFPQKSDTKIIFQRFDFYRVFATIHRRAK